MLQSAAREEKRQTVHFQSQSFETQVAQSGPTAFMSAVKWLRRHKMNRAIIYIRLTGPSPRGKTPTQNHFCVIQVTASKGAVLDPFDGSVQLIDASMDTSKYDMSLPLVVNVIELGLENEQYAIELD